jgi:hypothetical protein
VEEVVVWLDAEAAAGVDAALVGVDIGEVAAEAVVLQVGPTDRGGRRREEEERVMEVIFLPDTRWHAEMERHVSKIGKSVEFSV